MYIHLSNEVPMSHVILPTALGPELKMKAARYYGPGNVKLDQVPEPEAKEGQLKVKVHL